MAHRLGIVLKFKPGVTKEQAAEALKKVADVAELPTHSTDPKTTRWVPIRSLMDVIEEYDDTYGGPVWYTP